MKIKPVLIAMLILLVGMLVGGWLTYSYDPAIASKIEIQKIKEDQQRQELEILRQQRIEEKEQERQAELEQEVEEENIYQSDCNSWDGCTYHQVRNHGKVVEMGEGGITVHEW